jgi:citrate synthase
MPWLTAAEALARLGTRPQSLYASVSRGRIRARPDPKDPRRRLYDRDDVDRLARRSAGRRRAEAVAADAIRWGEPVLTSAITDIAGGRLTYRGQDAVALADTAGLEEVAALLWQAPVVDFSTPRPAAIARAPAVAPLRRVFAILADRAATDAPVLGRAPSRLTTEAAGLVAAIAAALGAPPGSAPLHVRLAAAWGRPDAADALRRAVVLLADHELNASTFAARVTASTGASLAAAALSGLAALTGPLHGSAAAGLAALLPLAGAHGADNAVRLWLAQGRPLPGFGHRLYPGGDVRGRALLAHLDPPATYKALAEAGSAATGEAPNVDFALAALAAAHDLPPDAPLLLFALSRSVGWLAHALEQTATGTLIRPRAHYAGVAPP